ncbi:hypothetical protein HK099_006908 [Clydaea vesicula]|uniref:Uncharacterized protein n=1 Tax=Clydaea vesicula TaxID=447962 RepID=A0AAD5U0Q4_9FUNG|nr:hypothetical protein HK099_006908 [Clydaea vesicula]
MSSGFTFSELCKKYDNENRKEKSVFEFKPSNDSEGPFDIQNWIKDIEDYLPLDIGEYWKHRAPNNPIFFRIVLEVYKDCKLNNHFSEIGVGYYPKKVEWFNCYESARARRDELKKEFGKYVYLSPMVQVKNTIFIDNIQFPLSESSFEVWMNTAVITEDKKFETIAKFDTGATTTALSSAHK